MRSKYLRALCLSIANQLGHIEPLPFQMAKIYFTYLIRIDRRINRKNKGKNDKTCKKKKKRDIAVRITVKRMTNTWMFNRAESSQLKGNCNPSLMMSLLIICGHTECAEMFVQIQMGSRTYVANQVNRVLQLIPKWFIRI